MNSIVKTYKNLNPILKGSLWFTFAILLQKGFTSLTTPFITRLLTMEEYGTYSLYQTWYSVFLTICTFNLSGSIFNTMMLDNIDDKDRLSNTIIFFECTITFLVFLIYFAISFFHNFLSGISTTQGLLIFIQVLTFIPQSIWIAKMKFLNEYKKVTILIVFQSILLLASNISVAYFFRGNIDFLILSTIIIQGAFSLALLVTMEREKIAFFSKKYWKYAFIIGLPLVFHYLAQSVLSQSDKIIIENFNGKEVTALYSLAHSLSFLLQILITAVNAAFMPWLYKKIKSKDDSKTNFIGVILLIGLSIFIVFISLLAPELLFLFGGKDYVEGKYLIPALSSTIIVLLVYNYYSATEFVYGETKIAAIATVIAALFNIGLNFIFIPLLGYNAAAYTTLASYLLMLGIHIVYSRKVLRKNNNFCDFFRLKLILPLLAVCVVINLLVSFTYEFYLVRYVLVFLFGLIIFVFLIIKRKNIFEFATIRIHDGESNNLD